MPVGDLPGWHQIFADDFNTDVPLGQFPAAVSSRWSAYPDGWPDTTHHGTYSCTKVCSVKNGMLDLYIHTENKTHYVAVPYPKLPNASSANGRSYMRYAVRFRADALPGYKTAWLLWPDVNVTPPSGEIDFPEGDLDSTINAYMHRANAVNGNDQDAFNTTARYTSWHTAVTEWTPASVKFYLDGALIGTSTTRIPSASMHFVLQTETSTDGENPADSTAGHVQIDWVAVYQPAP